MSCWSGSLGDALECLIDHRGKTPHKLGTGWTTTGVPVLSAIHLKGGRLAPEGARMVRPDVYERWMPVKLAAGDVLLTSEAPLGEVAYLADPIEACLGQRVFGLRGSATILEGRYLYYLLQHNPVRSQMFGRSSGTTVSGIRQSELVKITLALPPVHEQRAVAATLGALDEKVDSNRRRASTAEAVLDQLAATLAQRSCVALGELVEVDRTPLSPGDHGETLIDHYSLPAFDAYRLPDVTPGSSIKSGKLAVERPSVLVSRLNPRTNRTWFAIPRPAAVAAASTEFLVLRPRSEGSLGGVWLAVRDESFRAELARRATGTSGSHQRVRPADALSIEVPDTRGLPGDVLDEAEDLLQLAHRARMESRTLAELRDALLPELLSGRLRVPEAERVVADAT